MRDANVAKDKPLACRASLSKLAKNVRLEVLATIRRRESWGMPRAIATASQFAASNTALFSSQLRHVRVSKPR